MNFKQGDVIVATIGRKIGSEQKIFKRPCIIVQNDIGNMFSNTTIIIPLTKQNKKKMPTHYSLYRNEYTFLKYDSIVLCEQIYTIDLCRIAKKIGNININDLHNIYKILCKNFQLGVRGNGYGEYRRFFKTN